MKNALIGLLERYGLQERARQVIGKVRAATPGRLLLVYMILRQITAALGLTALGGHPQMVRPLIAPMACNLAALPLMKGLLLGPNDGGQVGGGRCDPRLSGQARDAT